MSRENFKINFMKSKMTIFVVTLLLSTWSLTGNAQTTIPKGKAQIIEFNNSTAKFTVPAGKTWYIINLFSYNCIILNISHTHASLHTRLHTHTCAHTYAL